jgi:two-component system nitrogen regulation sensor histidine kinase NtrY
MSSPAAAVPGLLPRAAAGGRPALVLVLLDRRLGWAVALSRWSSLLPRCRCGGPARAHCSPRALFRALAGSVNSYRDGEFNFGMHWQGQRRARRAGARARRAGRRAARAAPDAGAARAAARHHGAEHAGGDAAGRAGAMACSAARQPGRAQAAHEGGEAGRPAPRRRCWTGAADTAARGDRPRRRQPVRRRQRDDEEEQVYHLVAPRLPPQRPPARAAAAAPAHRRTAPPGSADLEEGDPRDQPRAQQLAGADRLAGAFRRRAGAARPARAAGEVFATIEDRARHLEGFIRGYARFAKLPQPSCSRCTGPLPGPAARQIGFVLDPRCRRAPAASTWRRWSRRCSTC